MLRRAMIILWPAFLVASLAEAAFFALVDPREWAQAVSPNAAYTLGFLFFWTMCALASLLTQYLATVPDGPGPRF